MKLLQANVMDEFF